MPLKATPDGAVALLSPKHRTDPVSVRPHALVLMHATDTNTLPVEPLGAGGAPI